MRVPVIDEPIVRGWVVGFLLDRGFDRVVLVRKARPAWMVGMWNGVGGKIEPVTVQLSSGPFVRPETPAEAMAREFEEETGVFVTTSRWEPFVRLTACTVENRAGDITEEPGVIHFMRAWGSFDEVEAVRSITDEHVEAVMLGNLLHAEHRQARAFRTVPNLRFLLPMAMHTADTYEVVDIVETSTTLRHERPA